MNRIEKIKQLYEMFDSLKPTGAQICKFFYRLKRDDISPFMKESIELILRMVNNSKQNAQLYSKLFQKFHEKIRNISYIINNDYLRAISEDIKYKNTQIGKFLERTIQTTKKMKSINDDSKIDFEEKMREMSKILTQSIEWERKREKFSEKEKKLFNTLVLGQRENPLQIERDMDHVMQDIKNLYETFRYIVGLYLSLFDSIDGSIQKNIDAVYFNSDLNVFSDMYKYRERWKKNKRNPRKDLRSLNEYLSLKDQPYPGIKHIFNWVFHKRQVKLYRIAESHHMKDVKQDKLQERKYAIYTKKRIIYVNFDEIYITQNDLAILFQFIHWLLFWIGLSLSINNLIGHYK